MKRIFLFTSLLGGLICMSTVAQSAQSPDIQQSTSTTDTRQPTPSQPKLKKNSKSGNPKMQSTTDTIVPKNRKQRRLAPDSLRRGGATRVDTVR
ncbi:hypothetical protein GO755_17605 [Spirosoma sp. HMF4905]|uniref:Uncharacterized protein n=1 Tax=Spirosoma arboris TaxID=2682092 RepID=A0A7K1SDK5_9BACT|nr:hypothetical protein [Spirosoma arboris]MVM31869.1 hypothetical protein [Spirosoma arboris]